MNPAPWGAAYSTSRSRKNTATFASTSWLVTPLKLGKEREGKPVRGKRAMTSFVRLTRFHPGSRYDLISGRSSLTSGVFSRKLAKPPMRYSHHQHLYAP